MKIIRTWKPCDKCRRPIHEREIPLDRDEVFIKIYVTNVILTEPWDGPQVDAGEFHHCNSPQPYEIVVPAGLW